MMIPYAHLFLLLYHWAGLAGQRTRPYHQPAIRLFYLLFANVLKRLQTKSFTYKRSNLPLQLVDTPPS